MEEGNFKNLFFPHDGHINQYGNSLVAGLIAIRINEAKDHDKITPN